MGLNHEHLASSGKKLPTLHTQPFLLTHLNMMGKIFGHNFQINFPPGLLGASSFIPSPSCLLERHVTSLCLKIRTRLLGPSEARKRLRARQSLPQAGSGADGAQTSCLDFHRSLSGWVVCDRPIPFTISWGFGGNREGTTGQING